MNYGSNMMSVLSGMLVSILSTRSSTQDADPEFDLLVEAIRRTNSTKEALDRAAQWEREHGSAEKALAAFEHEATEPSEQ
jgi:hypothetical protein